MAAPFDLGALRAFHATLTAAAAARIGFRIAGVRRPAPTCGPPPNAGWRSRPLPMSTPWTRSPLGEADVTTAWGDYDALIVPTAAAPAWCAEDEAPPGLTLRRRACLAPGSTPPGCLASASQASRIRMDGRSACRSSPFGHDDVVLEIGRRLEMLAPWADRWPALALTV